MEVQTIFVKLATKTTNLMKKTKFAFATTDSTGKTMSVLKMSVTVTTEIPQSIFVKFMRSIFVCLVILSIN